MMSRLYLQTSRRLATATMMTRRGYTTASLSSVITTLPSAISYPSPLQHNLNDLREQRRWMASKKGKGKKGGGGGKQNKKGPTKFEPIWSPGDVEYADNDSDDEMAEDFKDYNDLVKKLEEYGMEKKTLEMMDNNDNWKKLTNDELKKFNGKVVKVRDVEIYSEEADYGSDEDYSAAADDDDEYGYDPDKDYDDYNKDSEDLMREQDSNSPPPMRECIGKLIADLKFNGYERIEAGTLQKASTGETISTKEYILNKASDDEELLSLLVDNIGALDHIIQWLHVPAVWNNVGIEEEKDDDGKEDEEENPFKDL